MSEEAENEDAKIGHNSAIDKDTAKKLASVIERIETLNEEKKDLGKDIKEIFDEAKNIGFDVKAIRKIIKMRALAADDVVTENAIVETYCRALGMSSYLE